MYRLVLIGDRFVAFEGKSLTPSSTHIQFEATIRELAKIIGGHPTFFEAVVEAAQHAQNWALYLAR